MEDVARSAHFYEKIFGFAVISDFGGRGCAIAAGNRQVLLLLRRAARGTVQSPHDGDGQLHLAFAIAASELANWEGWLAQTGSQWKRGERGNGADKAFIFGIRINI